MECNYCQKEIEKGREVKVSRGLITVIETPEGECFPLLSITKHVDKLFAKKESEKENGI